MSEFKVQVCESGKTLVIEKDGELHRWFDLTEAVDCGQATADQHQEPVHVFVREDGSPYALRLPFCSPENQDNDPLVHVAVPTYRTIEDVKLRNKRRGHRFFEPRTMRFFGSRIQERIYVAKDGRAFFVTSERFVPPSGPAARRLYTVRVAELDGAINTFGEFQGYETGRAAHAAARQAATDPVWNFTPMPEDYTCGCGIYVHPSRRKAGAIHIADCPYASEGGAQ